MKPDFGLIRQAGHVVRDIDEAMAYWARVLGVGPFFVMRRVQIDPGYIYQGRPSASPTLSAAFAYSGGLQIELIQQHDACPSPYLDFLGAGRSGFHHWCTWVKPGDYDRIAAGLPAPETSIVHQGSLFDGSLRFIYLDTSAGTGGAMFEIADVLGSNFDTMMSSFEKASHAWDGADPVREIATS